MLTNKQESIPVECKPPAYANHMTWTEWQKDKVLWRHYLPTTSLADGKYPDNAWRTLIWVTPVVFQPWKFWKNLSKSRGLVRDLNPGPLAPKARIIPLDQRANYTFECKWNVCSDCIHVKCMECAKQTT